MELVKTSYKPEDVCILLKDISGLVEPQPASVRERLIQSGVHYCEMLPLEYEPSDDYIAQYEAALKNFSPATAEAVAALSEKIYRKHGENVCLVSLARAGISAGVLIKHYIGKKYGVECAHYAISIIRGRGIDKNAMNYILQRHSPTSICFVDGWTGKGAIAGQLQEAMKDYPAVDPAVAVIADPAGITPLCGTHDDFLIASSCLNSVVSGLISRTFLRSDIIGKDDFHGAAYYGNLADRDRTYEFINAVEKGMKYDDIPEKRLCDGLYDNREQLGKIAEAFGVSDINLIKPGIGETTRVLLRRIPDRVLIARGCDSFYISHILRLAEEKGVRVEEYPLTGYRCCGIIKNMPADA